MICPCKGCRDRTENCHTRCEGYRAFAEERKSQNRKRQEYLNYSEMAKKRYWRNVKKGVRKK